MIKVPAYIQYGKNTAKKWGLPRFYKITIFLFEINTVWRVRAAAGEFYCDYTTILFSFWQDKWENFIVCLKTQKFYSSVWLDVIYNFNFFKTNENKNKELVQIIELLEQREITFLIKT